MGYRFIELSELAHLIYEHPDDEFRFTLDSPQDTNKNCYTSGEYAVKLISQFNDDILIFREPESDGICYYYGGASDPIEIKFGISEFFAVEHGKDCDLILVNEDDIPIVYMVADCNDLYDDKYSVYVDGEVYYNYISEEIARNIVAAVKRGVALGREKR